MTNADSDAVGEWDTVDARTVYACEGFSVINETVRLPDGTQTEYDYVSEPPAVVIMPFTVDGEVVVIDEWREAVDRTNRGLPAGTIDPGEQIDTAARRELREETGYVAGNVERVLTVEPSNGIADSVHHHVLATECTPTAEQNLDADESISVDTCDFEELRAAVRADELRDGRAALSVMAYALTRR